MSQGQVAESAPGKVIVVQYGARRHYAVPAALARAGALEALYTDFCVGRGLGRVVPVLERLPFVRGRLRTERRRPPAEVLARTRTFESWGVHLRMAKGRASGPEERVRAKLRAHKAAGEKMIRTGFGSATHVLAMFGEGQRFLAEARARGLTVVTDVNIALSTEAIVVNEQRRFPGWEPPTLYWGETLSDRHSDFRPSEIMLKESHIFLCPSEFVRDDLIENGGVRPSQTRLLPYAVSPVWFSVEPKPEPGRVLFCGVAGLRKGVHYLGMAAEQLMQKGRPYEFVVAGGVSETFRNRTELNALTFLGRRSYSEMQREYARADVFAFPSLAEGSAGVTYEALGCGVPVVTTKAAGSVVRDGIDGLIVPERDPGALAEAIDRIIQDRPLRERMAVAARERAAEFTWEKFQGRLLECVFGSGR